jgi:L,D-transpeptidase ErfK/SrfK
MEGKEAKPIVPAGPDNQLGIYAIMTSMTGILIHVTIKPSSLYPFRSHGCIHVQAANMAKFFEKVELNTPGEVIYILVTSAVSEKRRVFCEIHRDYYALTKEFRLRGT